MATLDQQFRPEFLNRIDETIVFHEPTLDEITAKHPRVRQVLEDFYSQRATGEGS